MMRPKQRWGVVVVLGSLATLLTAATGCNKTDGSAGVTASVAGAPEGAGTAGVHPQAVQEDTRRPVVKFDTTLGAITVELDAEHAPISVKNFLWYANNGSYQQTIIHQLLPGYVAIGGGYDQKLAVRPTHFEIRNEAGNGLKNQRGTIAMARRPNMINSSTSQFFFNLADNPHLDQKGREKPEEYGYSVFGKVIDGLEVLDRISAAQVADKPNFPSMPVTPIVIKSVTRVR